MRYVDDISAGADVLPALRGMQLPDLRTWHQGVLSRALHGGGFSDAAAYVRCPATACLCILLPKRT